MSGPLRLGVIGLGRAFTLMLPAFMGHPRVVLAGAADPRPEARERFSADFGAPAYASPEELCADKNIQAVYVASPHQHHLDHVRMAARAGRHVLVEKPMALTLADALAMIAAAGEAGVRLIVGHSHSFDLPYLRTRELIASGAFGPVRMITALNFTDFMYRPRRPEELDTQAGGGVVFSQGAHQIDVARLLAGAPAKSVRAFTGVFDPVRPAEGAYQAMIEFSGGASAVLSYSGYGRFDSDELQGWIGEMGQTRAVPGYGRARAALRAAATPEAETALKNQRAYGLSGATAFTRAEPAAHNHFGFVIAGCERADLRPMPGGVEIYGEDSRSFEALPPPAVPRAEVIDELCAAALGGAAPQHDGAWGLATLEICLAILASAREGRVIELRHQV